KRILERSLHDGDRVEFGPVAYEYRGDRLRLVVQREGVCLVAHSLVVARDGRKLLSSVNLLLQSNQFVGILGASGSGKSSLLKCLAGLFAPAAGRLMFDGLALPAYLESYRAVVGYVSQEETLYAALTGRENLDYALRLRAAGDLTAIERAQIINQT